MYSVFFAYAIVCWWCSVIFLLILALNVSERVCVCVFVFMWLSLLLPALHVTEIPFFPYFVAHLMRFLCHFPFGCIFLLLVPLLCSRNPKVQLILAVSSARMKCQQHKNHQTIHLLWMQKEKLKIQSNVIIKYLSFRAFSHFQFLIVLGFQFFFILLHSVSVSFYLLRAHSFAYSLQCVRIFIFTFQRWFSARVSSA